MAASMRTSVCCSTSGCGFGAMASVATDLMTSRQSSLWLHRNNLGASGVAAWKQSHYLLCKGVGGGKKHHLKGATESRISLRPCLKVAAKVSDVDLVTATPLETPEEELAQMSDVVDLATTSSPELVDMSVTPTPLETPEELSQATLIWRAVKLPIYSAALVPLTVGGAVASLQSGNFHWGRYWLLLGSSVLVVAWLNLSNDVYDAETGVDKDKRESVVNMTGSREGVLRVAYLFLLAGFCGLVRVALEVGDIRVTALLTAAIACGYVYQCPPFRLSYKGLGEPLCFVAFGPLATTAFYLAQASKLGALPVTQTIIGASIIVGITTSLILFCSHFHQIESDLAVGKMSPLVRLGTEKGAKVVQAAVVTLYSLIVGLSLCKVLPLSCTLFSVLTLPIGILVMRFISENHKNKSLIFMAKYYCVRLHVAICAALVFGLLTGRSVPAPNFW
ncbi:unnamed protein product [Sphagnum troendelagicum]